MQVSNFIWCSAQETTICSSSGANSVSMEFREEKCSLFTERGCARVCLLILSLSVSLPIPVSLQECDSLQHGAFLRIKRICWHALFSECGNIWGGFPGGSVVKNPSTNARHKGDVGSIPGLGRSPWGANGNTLQYSCLENPMDRGAWQVAVHGVTKESDTAEQGCMLTLEPMFKVR